jgi:hypothetical protein
MTRADDLKYMLAAGRHPKESFSVYRRRRKLAAKSVKESLKGRVFHAPQFDKHGKGVPYRKAA